MDGAANQKGFGVGLVLISTEKLVVEKSLRLGFSVMNNEAEYEALLEGMSLVQRMGGGGEISYNVLGFKVGHRSSEGRVRGKG